MKDMQLLQFKAYDYLKELILSGRLERGVIHSQKKVADELGISKTPLRDAVLRLEQERYIDVYPSKGFVVHEMTRDDIRETYQIRSAIEVYCLKQLAADGESESFHTCVAALKSRIGQQKAIMDNNRSNKEFARKDYEFHRSIVEYVGNATMLHLYKDYMHQIFWQIELSFRQDGRMADTIKEHIHILEAIESHNKEQLEQQFENHLRTAEKINLKLLDEKLSITAAPV